MNIAEAIVQALAEAERMMGKAMATARAENSMRQKGTQNVGPKIG